MALDPAPIFCRSLLILCRTPKDLENLLARREVDVGSVPSQKTNKPLSELSGLPYKTRSMGARLYALRLRHRPAAPRPISTEPSKIIAEGSGVGVVSVKFTLVSKSPTFPAVSLRYST